MKARPCPWLDLRAARSTPARMTGRRARVRRNRPHGAAGRSRPRPGSINTDGEPFNNRPASCPDPAGWDLGLKVEDDHTLVAAAHRGARPSAAQAHAWAVAAGSAAHAAPHLRLVEANPGVAWRPAYRRKIWRRLRTRVAAEVAQLSRLCIQPGLAVVLVGEDPASEIYVRRRASTAGGRCIR